MHHSYRTDQACRNPPTKPFLAQYMQIIITIMIIILPPSPS